MGVALWNEALHSGSRLANNSRSASPGPSGTKRFVLTGLPAGSTSPGNHVRPVFIFTPRTGGKFEQLPGRRRRAGKKSGLLDRSASLQNSAANVQRLRPTEALPSGRGLIQRGALPPAEGRAGLRKHLKFHSEALHSGKPWGDVSQRSASLPAGWANCCRG